RERDGFHFGLPALDLGGPPRAVAGRLTRTRPLRSDAVNCVMGPYDLESSDSMASGVNESDYWHRCFEIARTREISSVIGFRVARSSARSSNEPTRAGCPVRASERKEGRIFLRVG